MVVVAGCEQMGAGVRNVVEDTVSGVSFLMLFNDYFKGTTYSASRAYHFTHCAPMALFGLDNTDDVIN